MTPTSLCLTKERAEVGDLAFNTHHDGMLVH